MMKLLLGGAASAALLAIAPAIAQPAPPPPPGVATGTAPVAPGPAAPRVQMRAHRMATPETRDAMVVHIRDMFAKLDTNKDGFVTREEANAHRKAMAGERHEKMAEHSGEAGMAHRDRGAMFDQLDTNKDGAISRQEFMTHPPMREQRVMAMHGGADGSPGMSRMGMRMHAKMFKTADANRDGKVSLQEVTAKALQHFDAMDANHDGTLSTEERMQMHQRFRDQRKAKQPA